MLSVYDNRVKLVLKRSCGNSRFSDAVDKFACVVILGRRRRYRLTVRTEPSQGLNTGSIPVRGNCSHICFLSGGERPNCAVMVRRMDKLPRLRWFAKASI